MLFFFESRRKQKHINISQLAKAFRYAIVKIMKRNNAENRVRNLKHFGAIVKN